MMISLTKMKWWFQRLKGNDGSNGKMLMIISRTNGNDEPTDCFIVCIGIHERKLSLSGFGLRKTEKKHKNHGHLKSICNI